VPETQRAFIARQLAELADKYRIPRGLLPDVMALLDKYASLEPRGRTADLVDELDKLFLDLERAGKLPEP